jgi:hypothetical protein
MKSKQMNLIFNMTNLSIAQMIGIIINLKSDHITGTFHVQCYKSDRQITKIEKKTQRGTQDFNMENPLQQREVNLPATDLAPLVRN